MKVYKITVVQAAKLLGINPQLLRFQIIDGKYHWATCDTTHRTRNNFAIFPKLFVEATGVTKSQLEEVTGEDWSEFFEQNFDEEKKRSAELKLLWEYGKRLEEFQQHLSRLIKTKEEDNIRREENV